MTPFQISEILTSFSIFFCGFPLRRVRHYIRKAMALLWETGAARHITCRVFPSSLLLSCGRKRPVLSSDLRENCTLSRSYSVGAFPGRIDLREQGKTVWFFPLRSLAVTCLSKGTEKLYRQQLLLAVTCHFAQPMEECKSTLHPYIPCVVLLSGRSVFM